MPLDKADVNAIRDAATTHRDTVRARLAKLPDYSVTVVRDADGTLTAHVNYGGKFREIGDVGIIDMGAN